MSNMRMNLASPPDREKLVVEFFIDNEQWAELNQENGELNLEIYPKRSKQPWQIPFDEVIQALTEGRNRLIGD